MREFYMPMRGKSVVFVLFYKFHSIVGSVEVRVNEKIVIREFILLLRMLKRIWIGICALMIMVQYWGDVCMLAMKKKPARSNA